MFRKGFQYSENVLQWIWQHLLFETKGLETSDGKAISIYDQGKINHSDGPDFLYAKIQIDGVIWHGAVELHITSANWKQHGHHYDDAYNKVVLHVVAQDAPKSVTSSNGSVIPTLNLLPYLSSDISNFISELKQVSQLPCINGLRYISEEAFIKQIEKAHIEYFEKKGDDFLCFYEPEFKLSISWKRALVRGIFDGFGITHNRNAMIEVGDWVLEQPSKPVDELINEALNFAGFGKGSSSIQWNFKSVYPASHPQKRIAQAIRISVNILNTPFECFLEKDVLSFWRKWAISSGFTHSYKYKLLYGTVFLPSLYVLGTILASKKLSLLAFHEWQSFKAPIPSHIVKPFEAIPNLDPKNYRKKLGSVYQLQTYCKARRCHECFVLKKVILS